jgi:hypothetical protein
MLHGNKSLEWVREVVGHVGFGCIVVSGIEIKVVQSDNATELTTRARTTRRSSQSSGRTRRTVPALSWGG